MATADTTESAGEVLPEVAAEAAQGDYQSDIGAGSDYKEAGGDEGNTPKDDSEENADGSAEKSDNDEESQRWILMLFLPVHWASSLFFESIVHQCRTVGLATIYRCRFAQIVANLTLYIRVYESKFI